jgi:hypothetical protein
VLLRCRAATFPDPDMPEPATITPELIASLDEASLADLARRLEDDDYPTPFAGLNDWHLLRAVAIHRPELARPYVHLVDQEPFDEE